MVGTKFEAIVPGREISESGSGDFPEGGADSFVVEDDFLEFQKRHLQEAGWIGGILCDLPAAEPLSGLLDGESFTGRVCVEVGAGDGFLMIVEELDVEVFDFEARFCVFRPGRSQGLPGDLQ